LHYQDKKPGFVVQMNSAA